MAVIEGRKFGDDLVKAWGFKNCRDIKIHIPCKGIVTITAEFNATKEQCSELETLLKKYRLEEIDAQSINGNQN